MCEQFQNWADSVMEQCPSTSVCDNDYTSVDIIENELCIMTDSAAIDALPLRFCPVCGEELEGDLT